MVHDHVALVGDLNAKISVHLEPFFSEIGQSNIPERKQVTFTARVQNISDSCKSFNEIRFAKLLSHSLHFTSYMFQTDSSVFATTKTEVND